MNAGRGFEFHPLVCYLDESSEALAGILGPGNAGANTASDHVAVPGAGAAARSGLGHGDPGPS